MKEKDAWALIETSKEFTNQERFHKKEPSENFQKGWLAGFNFAKEKMLDLCDAKHQIVGYAEINRLGEKPVK